MTSRRSMPSITRRWMCQSAIVALLRVRSSLLTDTSHCAYSLIYIFSFSSHQALRNYNHYISAYFPSSFPTLTQLFTPSLSSVPVSSSILCYYWQNSRPCMCRIFLCSSSLLVDEYSMGTLIAFACQTDKSKSWIQTQTLRNRSKMSRRKCRSHVILFLSFLLVGCGMDGNAATTWIRSTSPIHPWDPPHGGFSCCLGGEMSCLRVSTCKTLNNRTNIRKSRG